MITMAQRIEQLRTEKGISRPALSAALGLPRTAAEKFETGRQTPTQDQQEKLAAFFGVTVQYLRGEFNDKTETENWMNGSLLAQEVSPVPVPAPALKQGRKTAPADLDGSSVFDAMLRSEKFQESLRSAILDVLRSPEGQRILAKAVGRKLEGR